MAHFAQINEDNIVGMVLVVNNDIVNNLPFPESEQLGIDFLRATFKDNARWKQTSYNGNFRKNYAGLGFIYDPVRDAFIPPKPYPSFVFDENTCQWTPPVPYPNDGNLYIWDEATQSWVAQNV